MSAEGPKAAIVTAAGRGIGAACARALAAAGHRVAVQSRGEECEALAREIGGVAVRGALTEPADLERLVARAREDFGRVDVLVNGGGHPAKGDLLALDDAAWEEGFDMLFLSVVRMIRLVVPEMAKAGGGSIVTISSLWAAEPHLDAPVSSALRAGVGALTRLYAERLAPLGIRVNAVLPGFVDNHPVAERFRSAIPSGRVAGADEIGAVVAFLASPAASYVTGQSLRADAGLTRGL